ncbi:hypothetical protein [Hyalangium rubrum]|uniref:HEAT repeat domain-containing protein n=1 Tax=Hyalangium rubrum TaxID=3103134 RepID=A0ABU5H243_9BACT|nr:hypothetical protein [Hyalangium sp. s54d21]MDY7227396.1 hypothetical protein [Hyalangium sp. s54d21]
MSSLTENGARRGAEVRCPGCTRFKPPPGMCPHCGCGAVPLERYGAARGMLAGGVDRFSLAERVAVLDPVRVEMLERQYAAQWALAQGLVEDVRRCEAELLQRGFVEETEDALAALLPTDPEFLLRQVGPPERPETLEALFTKGASWEVQRLAALALVHQGAFSPNALAAVRGCLEEDGRLGIEAALALTRWRVYRWARLRAEGWQRVRELARKALASSELAPRAAVAWVRASPGKALEVDVLFNLRAGLAHPDEDVRFECALCLKDEAGLAAALDSTDAGRASEARRELTSLGSPRVFEQLARQGGAAFARDVVDRLPWPPPPGALEVLLAVSEREPEPLAEVMQRLAEQQPFVLWPSEEQSRWKSWARSVLGRLPGEVALRFLHWAAQPPLELGAAQAFVDATAEALKREPADVRARSLGDAYFSRFLALVRVGQEPLLNRWAREEESGPPLLREVMVLTSRLQDWQEPLAQAARVMRAVWEGPGRELLLAPLGQAVREWSALSGREVLVDWVWQRFQEHPGERADLLTVFAPWRQLLWERQLAAPEDAVERFQAWWAIDPEGFAWQANALMEDAPVEELPRRVGCVLAAGQDTVPTRPRTASLAVFYAAAALANAFRAGHDVLKPEVERFLEWFPGFEQRVRSTPPEHGGRAPQRDFLEELHTEVRLMRERLDVLREDEDSQWQQEMQRKVEASRRRDLERQQEKLQRQEEEAPRTAEEAQRAAMAAYLADHAKEIEQARVLLQSLHPRIEEKPIDSEVLFPEGHLPTLPDYVRLIKAMSGSNAVFVLAAAGLEVSDWTVEATAWGQAMTQRLDLGVRFGQLVSAPWQ